MRKTACQTWVSLAKDPRFVFLSGDLGFNALEPLQVAAGNRFINAGVAEQNMVSVAAGLAYQGLRPWVYSIAPFCYARPFEQIRNDIALHRLPVQLVGNGGGFGYGSMGATHHALEDYGVLATLPSLRIQVPAFEKDLETLLPALANSSHPNYLRLGQCEKPKDKEAPPYAAWRQLTNGPGPLLTGVGPLVGGVWDFILKEIPPAHHPELWVVSELPLAVAPPPDAWWSGLERKQKLLVFEEHVVQGGLGSMLATLLLSKRKAEKLAFRAVGVQGYLSGRYGSQAFHRKENGLDPVSLKAAWEGLL